MMTSAYGMGAGAAGLASPMFKLEYPQSVAVYTSYADAQADVDALSDQNFPVANLAIVGTDLKLVERVTGRKTWGTVLGQGNVLCSFVHLGVATRLGDNNFVAAHSSIDHHNVIGSHSLFGPGCLLSGRVRVGDECLFGSGVIVQPNLSIGSNSKIASGSVILRDIQDNESVRLHL